MKSNQYSGEATAKFVGEELMRTLGLTRNEVANKFVHSYYDGVYASKDERVRGGGCLSLMKHFANWCRQEEENFSGSWDLGHQLQIVYGKVIKEHPEIQNFNRKMYTIMSEHKSHQAGIRFKEIAEELSHAVLTNKGAQETRWVRAELRSLQTYLRNIPTLAIIYGREQDLCARNCDITGQKEAERFFKQIQNAEDIAFAIGLCQLLEEYASVSLAGQSIKTTPSEIPGITSKLKKSLDNLANSWTWTATPLEMGGIGIPMNLISEMKAGEYTPYISDNVRICAAKKLNASIAHENKINDILFSLEESDVTQPKDEVPNEDISAGSIAILDFSPDTCKAVEKKLEKIAGDVLQEFEQIKVPEHLVEGSRTFSEIDWYLNENSTEDKTKAATDQIESLLSSFPTGVSRIDNFRDDIESIVEGYEAYLRILILSRQVFDHETKKLTTDEIYQKFISRLGSTTKSFQELFEFVNIRTYSEAICETIGSIMAIAVSNGRNLQSYNLDKELLSVSTCHRIIRYKTLFPP